MFCGPHVLGIRMISTGEVSLAPSVIVVASPPTCGTAGLGESIYTVSLTATLICLEAARYHSMGDQNLGQHPDAHTESIDVDSLILG